LFNSFSLHSFSLRCTILLLLRILSEFIWLFLTLFQCSLSHLVSWPFGVISHPGWIFCWSIFKCVFLLGLGLSFSV
jgi:hypothetical protein